MLELETVRDMLTRIKALEKKLECFRAIALKPPVLDGMPKAKAQSSMTEKVALQIVETERELAAIRSSLPVAKEKLGCAILDRVEDPVAAAAMLLRFVSGMTLTKICAQLNYDRTYLFRAMKRGKAEFVSKGE